MDSLVVGSYDTTSSQSHTGKYSLMISPGSVASLSRSINYYGDTLYTVSSLNTFILNNGGNIPLFSPDSGTYLIGAWVKEQNRMWSDRVQG